MHTFHCSVYFQLTYVSYEPAPADHMHIVAKRQSWLPGWPVWAVSVVTSLTIVHT